MNKKKFLELKKKVSKSGRTIIFTTDGFNGEKFIGTILYLKSENKYLKVMNTFNEKENRIVGWTNPCNLCFIAKELNPDQNCRCLNIDNIKAKDISEFGFYLKKIEEYEALFEE